MVSDSGDSTITSLLGVSAIVLELLIVVDSLKQVGVVSALAPAVARSMAQASSDGNPTRRARLDTVMENHFGERTAIPPFPARSSCSSRIGPICAGPPSRSMA